MKKVKNLLCTVCIWMVAFSLLLSGCSILDKKEEKGAGSRDHACFGQ